MARGACNSCTALNVKTGRHICRIYDNRPAVCREFLAGSKACLEARDRANISHAPID
jgi:Fe-S-cluster containining protein